MTRRRLRMMRPRVPRLGSMEVRETRGTTFPRPPYHVTRYPLLREGSPKGTLEVAPTPYPGQQDPFGFDHRRVFSLVLPGCPIDYLGGRHPNVPDLLLTLCQGIVPGITLTFYVSLRVSYLSGCVNK